MPENYTLFALRQGQAAKSGISGHVFTRRSHNVCQQRRALQVGNVRAVCGEISGGECPAERGYGRDRSVVSDVQISSIVGPTS